MKAFLALFLLFNLFTFFVFGYDKYLSRRNRPRISVRTLIRLALFGGSVGAVFAQNIFRHKTQKYRYLFWVILTIQFGAFELAWLYGPQLAQWLRSF
jgi:uncharacterized membrane protein YsdA (DUF1294 family)